MVIALPRAYIVGVVQENMKHDLTMLSETYYLVEHEQITALRRHIGYQCKVFAK